MPLLTGNVKSHLKKQILEYKSFYLMEESVLKATNVKLSLLVWKIKHFKVQF